MLNNLIDAVITVCMHTHNTLVADYSKLWTSSLFYVHTMYIQWKFDNLITQVTRSECTAIDFEVERKRDGTPYYRFNPSDIDVDTLEVDREKLVDMIVTTKKYLNQSAQMKDMKDVVQLLQQSSIVTPYTIWSVVVVQFICHSRAISSEFLYMQCLDLVIITS